jgi:hypothetical protein
MQKQQEVDLYRATKCLFVHVMLRTALSRPVSQPFIATLAVCPISWHWWNNQITTTISLETLVELSQLFFSIRWQVVGTGTTQMFFCSDIIGPPTSGRKWISYHRNAKRWSTGCDHGDRSDPSISPSRFSLTTEEWQRETSGNARPPIVNIVISSDLHSQLSLRAGGCWVNERLSLTQRPRTEMK